MTRTPTSIAPHTVFDLIGAWLLAVLWIFPLVFAVWTAFHGNNYGSSFNLLASPTLENFRHAWNAAPFARYLANTFLLVSMVIVAQFVICTLAAYAFARFDFPFRDVAFFLVFVQLLILPEVLMTENYRTLSYLGLNDTVVAIGLPYIGSAFGIFLLRQTFKTVPVELEQAARVEGAGALRTLWLVYVPLAKPVYIAYGLVLVSYHWNNLLWPLIITNSVETRPVTVGLQVFAQADQGVDWGVITAATLITSAPLLIAFLIFQSLFVQSFMRAGLK
jgi:sn-glycerol 3-phosphate transport system permease protein